MRIAVNTRLLLKGKLEGMGWFTHEVLNRMVAAHPQDEFFFLFDRPYDPGFVFGKNVTPVVVSPPARHPFLFYLWFEWRLPAVLEKLKADVFLSPDNFLSLRSKLPTVLVTHDLAPFHFPKQITPIQRWYYHRFIPKFNRRAEEVVTVSNFTKQDIVKQFGIAEEKITVACNGCRDIFRPLEDSEKKAVRETFADGKPYFLYVGAVHPRKNVHGLIRAFDIFKRNTGADAGLLIGGRFAWKAGEVQQAYEASPFKKDIRFLGYLGDDKLPAVTGAAFAATYVSFFEGFGIPLLEAMRCGIPVITSNISSMPEVAGNAGLLVDPYRPEDIARGMQQLWEDPHLYREKATAGIEQEKKFTWEGAAEVVYEALRRAAGN
ncbi:MAG: glycosyltransferase [Saprospirales bacterium]|nr:glycosyltransferase [Saprospirales bacterium]